MAFLEWSNRGTQISMVYGKCVFAVLSKESKVPRQQREEHSQFLQTIQQNLTIADKSAYFCSRTGESD